MASESPPRKRAKLSLKFSKSQKLFDSPTKSMRKLAVSSENDTKLGSHNTLKDEKQCTGKLPVQNGDTEHPPEPYVGFYNIGNTCYLNSVLQALRYCPQFVDTLQMLSEIGQAWLDQKSGTSVGTGDKDGAGDRSRRDDNDAGDVESISRMLRLLKEMLKVYDLMRDKEDNFLLMPSTDTDMAINPEMVLEALRVVNPMFEGYFQHDAQELLCSLLSSLKEVQEKLSKDLRLGDKDAINNNVPPFTLVCRTPTVTKAGGSLKGGCSPSINRALKRGLQSGSPLAARKHLYYPSARGDAAEEADPVTKTTEPSECTGSGDGAKGKKFRRKSMRNRQIEREKKEKKSEELSEEKETPKEVKAGKKKSLGIKRLCKLTNQPTILSKLGILRKKKLQDSSPTSLEAKPSHQQTLSEEAGNKGVSVSHVEMDSKPGSPPLDSRVKAYPCGMPTVASQQLEGSEGLFQGSLVLRTKCLECENHTERCEEFQDVSVPVHCPKKSEEEEDSELQPIDPPSESNDSCDVDVSQQVSLDWALSEFTLGERLSDTNKYFCDSCLHLTEAERFLLFDELPQVMVIHLKRFSSIQHTFSPGGSIPKLNDIMETPLSITMDRWCTKSCKQRFDTYRLLSVVSHTGTSSSSGHYLSYVRVPKLEPVCTEDGEPREVTGPTDQYQWVLFDDDNVSSLSDDEFEKCINNPCDSEGEVLDTPYLLFYSRVSNEGATNQVK